MVGAHHRSPVVPEDGGIIPAVDPHHDQPPAAFFRFFRSHVDVLALLILGPEAVSKQRLLGKGIHSQDVRLVHRGSHRAVGHRLTYAVPVLHGLRHLVSLRRSVRNTAEIVVIVEETPHHLAFHGLHHRALVTIESPVHHFPSSGFLPFSLCIKTSAYRIRTQGPVCRFSTTRLVGLFAYLPSTTFCISLQKPSRQSMPFV